MDLNPLSFVQKKIDFTVELQVYLEHRSTMNMDAINRLFERLPVSATSTNQVHGSLVSADFKQSLAICSDVKKNKPHSSVGP